MEFVKEFATFLFKNDIIKFGDFTLSSGKQSAYYIDLRLIPSFPHEFRKMIKFLQNQISEKVGLDQFDALVSVPTGGLVIASALSLETVKPLIYVRSKPKDYGTTKMVEGKIQSGMKVLMIDDVATTGGSVINAIKSLRGEKITVEDSFVIINRMEGADKALLNQGVTMHSLANIMNISNYLYEQDLITKDTLEKVQKQIDN